MEPILAASPESVRAAISLQKSQGRLKKLRKPARHRLSKAPERNLQRALNTLVRRLGQVVESQVIPELGSIVAAAPNEFQATQDARGNVRHDQFRERLLAVIRGVTVTAGTILDIERLLTEAAQDVDNRNQTQQSRTMAAVAGVQPLIAEPWLADLIEDFVSRNAELITRVSEDYIRQVGEVVSEAVRSGQRAEQIETELRQRFVNTERAAKDADSSKLKRRMRLIARDQIASLNSDITKTRQTQLGLRRFVWRTARDERVRGRQVTREGTTIGGKYPKAKPAHTELEGQIFDWDKGANGLFPGRPINCRCVAEPYLPDLIEDAPVIGEASEPPDSRSDSLGSRVRIRLAAGLRRFWRWFRPS